MNSTFIQPVVSVVPAAPRCGEDFSEVVMLHPHECAAISLGARMKTLHNTVYVLRRGHDTGNQPGSFGVGAEVEPLIKP